MRNRIGFTKEEIATMPRWRSVEKLDNFDEYFTEIRTDDTIYNISCAHILHKSRRHKKLAIQKYCLFPEYYSDIINNFSQQKKQITVNQLKNISFPMGNIVTSLQNLFYPHKKSTKILKHIFLQWPDLNRRSNGKDE
jgi:hypothetical protein